MALGADRAFLETSSQMDHRRLGWKSRIPGFIRNGRTKPLTQEAGDGSRFSHDQDTKDSDREKYSKKSVTMAHTSRYMTSRRLYTARKPLITAEHQISILKNPLTQESFDKVDIGSMENYQKEMEGAASKFSETYTPESISIPQFIASSPSASKEDLCASLSLSDLTLCSCLEDPDFSSVPSANKHAKRSLSSPPIGDLSLTVPLIPKWSSTQRTLSHSYSSQACPSQKTKTKISEHGKISLLKTGSSLSYKDFSSEPKQMSTYEANYRACAIPSSLPPSSDRKSPSWDPDKEYQALLDYTYPIRPHVSSTWSSSKCRKSLMQTDPLLQDSGIELDRFCSSSSLSCLDQTLMGIKQSRGFPASGQRLSEPKSVNLRELSHSKSSDGRLSSSLYSSLEQVGLSVDSLDCEGKETFHQRKSGIFSTSTFLRSTGILPQPGSLGELDEEFLRLPEQLQELQDLSHQLRDITAQMNQPVSTSWESLEKESGSGTYSAAQVEHQAAEVSTTQEEQYKVNGRSASEVPLEKGKLSEQLKGLGDRVQMISSEVNKGSLREVGAIIGQLSGTTLSEFQQWTGTHQGEDEAKESLLQHIQAFCGNLEELIQWLYKVVEKMEGLSPPTVDIDSVKASLTDYKTFQKEIQAHQPLTASVLQTGEMLLCCMNSASPFLKETLMLIERQSRVLETHSEHLFSSILSAMDCLTEPLGRDDTERMS